MQPQLATTPNSGVPMAMDPVVSEQQRRAMYAALHGKSTIGIPKSVAEKFVGPEAHDEQDDRTRGAGVALRDPDGRLLFIKRSGAGDQAGMWAFPGGYVHHGENETAAAIRELGEEIGLWLQRPLRVRFDSASGVTAGPHRYTTFVADVEESFVPMLNGESDDYVWAKPDQAPQPLHPGVEKMFKDINSGDPIGGSAMDDGKKIRTQVDYSPAKDGGDHCGACRHYAANKCALVAGRIDPGYWCKLFEARGHAMDERYAFDRASVRTTDANGNLHVAITNISKANVCPYLGQEIPDWQQLGLQPDRIYRLLRHPDELRKAVPTFNNLQLLSKHVPISADDHQPDLVVGSTGTDAEFIHPYLKNSLVVWAQDAIDLIESEAQKELSSAYRYRAEMTPGTYLGESYDGIMRDIVGNHVALVKEGRAGTDVVVGDSKPAVIAQQERKIEMSKAKLSRTAAFVGGALTAFLLPKLAQDAQMPDLNPVLADVTAKNIVEMRPKIVEGITAAFKDIKLAKDAALDDLPDFLNKIEGEDEEPEEELKKSAFDAEQVNGLKEFLKDKLSEDDMRAFDNYLCGDQPPPPELAGAPVKPEANDEENEPVNMKAMDEAVKVAVDDATKKLKANQQAIRDAEKFVRPWVGELAIAHDSSEAVLRASAKILGIEGADKVHPDALPALIKLQPLPGDKPKQDQTVAMDAASIDDFTKRYPMASRIGQLG